MYEFEKEKLNDLVTKYNVISYGIHIVTIYVGKSTTYNRDYIISVENNDDLVDIEELIDILKMFRRENIIKEATINDII